MMTLAQACCTIETLAYDYGYKSILDLLVYMGDNLDDFTENEVRAYRMFMHAGRKMFAPKETV